jgi:hypothetical protein
MSRAPLTAAQQMKRIIALLGCGLLGLYSGVGHAEPYMYSRYLADGVARQIALTVAVRWTVLGLIVGLVLARMAQSARTIELVISLALIVLLWGSCTGSTFIDVR